jgi:DNA-binding transcriptional MerR regulator
MKIGELSNVSGVAAHTIRFYESKGLLPKASRGMNGYRAYNSDSIERLANIQCAKRLGFTLDDILLVLADRTPEEGLDHDKVLEQLDMRLLEVEALMQQLTKQREEIKSFKTNLQAHWRAGKCFKPPLKDKA